MKFLFIEPFFHGSHRLFAEGLAACSSHEIDILSMPGENWRWRMLGAALHMADSVPPLHRYDGLIVSDLFNLADFKALVNQPCPPVLVYFHENQITYPQPPGDRAAFQLGIINITTALAADRVAFNSRFHLDAFLAAVPAFLDRGSDFRPGNTADRIRQKASVLHPGITLGEKAGVSRQTDPMLILWNHRWGYDKGCSTFVEALELLEARGAAFHLALTGENFGRIPPPFEKARHRFQDRFRQFGFVRDRRTYETWLQRSAVAVSTARQENFGMSMIEAMVMGCVPLLPDRLAYPEILPLVHHDRLLYKNTYDLVDKLAAMAADYSHWEALGTQLAGEMQRFLWPNIVAAYDDVLENLVAQT